MFGWNSWEKWRLEFSDCPRFHLSLTWWWMSNTISNLFEGRFRFYRGLFRILSNICDIFFAKTVNGWLPLIFSAKSFITECLTGFSIRHCSQAQHRQWQWFQSLLVSYDFPPGFLVNIAETETELFFTLRAWYS